MHVHTDVHGHKRGRARFFAGLPVLTLVGLSSVALAALGACSEGAASSRGNGPDDGIVTKSASLAAPGASFERGSDGRLYEAGCTSNCTSLDNPDNCDRLVFGTSPTLDGGLCADCERAGQNVLSLCGTSQLPMDCPDPQSVNSCVIVGTPGTTPPGVTGNPCVSSGSSAARVEAVRALARENYERIYEAYFGSPPASQPPSTATGQESEEVDAPRLRQVEPMVEAVLDDPDAFCSASSDSATRGVYSTEEIERRVGQQVRNRDHCIIDTTEAVAAARAVGESLTELLCDGDVVVAGQCSEDELVSALLPTYWQRERLAGAFGSSLGQTTFGSCAHDSRSPLVLDMDGRGIGETHGSVAFDVLAEGELVHTAWTAPGDGLLARDLDGSGCIESGAELYGEGTRVVDEASGLTRNARDGFEALSTMDTNGDGVVDGQDAHYAELVVWQDNGDGRCEPHELRGLESAGIVGLSLEYEVRDVTDAAGSRIPYWSHYLKADGTQGLLVDIFFAAR